MAMLPGCTSRKWGSLTPFRNQKIVEGCLAWQVGTGGQLRMRQECGRRWLGKGRTDWLSALLGSSAQDAARMWKKMAWQRQDRMAK